MTLELDLKLPEPEKLRGFIDRITFADESSGYFVLRVQPLESKAIVVVTCNAAAAFEGQSIEVSGDWIDNRHGRQFKAKTVDLGNPKTPLGIEKYLASGLIKGIGPSYAKRLVRHFGEKIFDVIHAAPARLCEIDGIGELRKERIVESFRQQQEVERILPFLFANGISTAYAVRVYKLYGNDAVAQVSRDPYVLARDIQGIGFTKADEIAAKIGLAKDSQARARGGIAFVMQNALSAGHVGLPRKKLLAEANALLSDDHFQMPDDQLAAGLEWEILEDRLIADTIDGEDAILVASYYRMEKATAERLLALANGEPPWGLIEADKAIPWVEQRNGITLSDSQRHAARTVLGSKVSVVTGGPGCGKTTLVNSILTILLAKRMRVLQAAPTGKAAKRMAESTGNPSSTIHRLLGHKTGGGFLHDQNNPLEADVVILDESSMIDVPLIFSLVRALPPSAGLILVGDIDQIPSVGAGRVLGDIIDSGAVPVAALREIFRQAQGSRIITNAHLINQGLMPENARADEASDFYWQKCEDAAEIPALIVDLVKRRVPSFFGIDARDIQVLTPSRRSETGVVKLNQLLQEAINPVTDENLRFSRFDTRYSVGDKVMQVRNNYDREVFNGDSGVIVALDKEGRELTVQFDDRRVAYDFNDLDELVLCYATTIHKSQGSQYPAVIVPITTQHFTMLRRNLIYTAVTRATRLVIMIGQQRAMKIAVEQIDGRTRHTKLNEWLTRPRLMEH